MSAHLPLIVTPGASVKELSKLQKQFNTYSRKVEKLKAELAATRTMLEKAQQLVGKVLLPLEKRKREAKAAMLWLLDRQHQHLAKRDRTKLAEFIVEQAHALIQTGGHKDLIPLVEKYEAKSYETFMQDLDRDSQETLKKAFAKMGIELDMDEDGHSDEDEETFGRPRTEEARTNERPKTAKQLAREEKQRQEARHITETVRGVYRQLVKAFHPDREPDETEKARKTLIMQRITEAYEHDDLFELLRLQLQYEQQDGSDFARLPDAQLKHYNKLLKEQIEELQDELEDLQESHNPFGSFYHHFCVPAERLDANVKREAKEMKRELKELEAEKKAFEDIETVKLFLKGYRKAQKKMARNPLGGEIIFGF